MYLNIWSSDELDDLQPGQPRQNAPENNRPEGRLSRYLNSLSDLLRRNQDDSSSEEDEE